MYIASNGTKTAVIERDYDAYSPRDSSYQENLGKMICWHSRYNLGDNHDFKNSREFAERLANNYLTMKDIFKAIKAGQIEDLRFTEADSYQITGEMGSTHLQLQANIGIPGHKKWEDMDWHVSNELESLSEGDMEDLLACMDSRDIMSLLSESDKLLIKPVYLYDHSGLSVNTGSFIGRAHHAEWDSGIIGFIYMDKETAMKELALPGDNMRIAKILSDKEKEKLTFRSPNKDVTEFLKGKGFSPVLSAEYIKNANGSEPDKLFIDENEINMGHVFKKDHKLYILTDNKSDGSFGMEPIAVFNPDLKSLTEETWRSRAGEMLDSEVAEYDNYLRGEIYGYRLFEGLEEVDSCWGFNPGSERIEDLMKEELIYWYGPGMSFEFSYDSKFDIEDYYRDNDFPAFREAVTKAVVTQLYEDFQALVPFPYKMSFDEIRGNKDGVLDNIVEKLYDAHEEPGVESVRDAILEHAGMSRSVEPKLTVDDLEPSRDYTAEELMGLLKKKPSLADMITAAAAQQPAATNKEMPFKESER